MRYVLARSNSEPSVGTRRHSPRSGSERIQKVSNSNPLFQHILTLFSLRAICVPQVRGSPGRRTPPLFTNSYNRRTTVYSTINARECFDPFFFLLYLSSIGLRYQSTQLTSGIKDPTPVGISSSAWRGLLHSIGSRLGIPIKRPNTFGKRSLDSTNLIDAWRPLSSRPS